MVRVGGESKRALGDWQTPRALADALVARLPVRPSVVVEPTCGEGALLEAAARRWPGARLFGVELREDYAAHARARLPAHASIRVADVFAIDWARELARFAHDGPLLVLGNPPWVTAATLGALGVDNGPARRRVPGLRGLDARTGKSNFDLAEAVLLRLLEAVAPRRATLAMLCKTSVARRVLERADAAGWGLTPGGLFAIDAARHFAASVDAALLVCEAGGAAGVGVTWPVFADLEARAPRSHLAFADGAVIADADAHARTAHLAGSSSPAWRSGIKHDCAAVMELTRAGAHLENGLGERVAIEDELVFPLVKGSDLDRGLEVERAVVVPQRTLGEDTSALGARAPAAQRYLRRHRARLFARKSSVYRGRPEFAIFGVGPYAFAPYKVAISGLHKRLRFVLLGPRAGRPVMLDDTCYFLPFEDEQRAGAALEALRSPIATEFLRARIFWDQKRPIRKAILQQLDLDALFAELAAGP